MSKCERCGWDDHGTGDSAHVCVEGIQIIEQMHKGGIHSPMNACMHRDECRAKDEEIERLRAEVGAKQAEIDRLMLEFCPGEMTEAQTTEWARNQRPVSEEEQQRIARLAFEAVYSDKIHNSQADRPA